MERSLENKVAERFAILKQRIDDEALRIITIFTEKKERHICMPEHFSSDTMEDRINELVLGHGYRVQIDAETRIVTFSKSQKGSTKVYFSGI